MEGFEQSLISRVSVEVSGIEATKCSTFFLLFLLFLLLLFFKFSFYFSLVNFVAQSMGKGILWK
jgi:hypothetical protein